MSPKFVCRGPLPETQAAALSVALMAGDLQTARELDASRIACGYDLTEIIEALPIDGRVYTRHCDLCKLAFTARRVPL